jgi:hypothetical protein
MGVGAEYQFTVEIWHDSAQFKPMAFKINFILLGKWSENILISLPRHI